MRVKQVDKVKTGKHGAAKVMVQAVDVSAPLDMLVGYGCCTESLLLYSTTAAATSMPSLPSFVNMRRCKHEHR